MLRIEKIVLTQFRNYASFEAFFDQPVVGICGANGVGKTNLLDAIHYLGLTKSYFSRYDEQAVQTGCQGFRIEGVLQHDEQPTEVTCILRPNGKKEFAANGIVYDRLSAHIGKFPVVVIAPDDAVLVTGESKERRAFIDQLLAQIDPAYLQGLIRYNRVLLQRNALLKGPITGIAAYTALLEVLDEQLAKLGQELYHSRAVFLSGFLPLVLEQYTAIVYADKPMPDDVVSISYQSHLHELTGEALLRSSREADLRAQRTTKGIHRDDLCITMREQPFRQMASQGQRKSLLFALKLAQVQIIKEKKGFAPLLLLDDIFEKLDDTRMENLLKKICGEHSGQVFITDTSPVRLDHQLSKLAISYQPVLL